MSSDNASLRNTQQNSLLSSANDMDADEHRLIVDVYLCEFVFICGCLRRFRSDA